MKLSISIFFLILAFTLGAQDIDRSHITYSNALFSLEQLKQLLAIPNDANHPEDIEKNVVWCVEQMQQQGFVMERLETSTVPLLLATYAQEVADAPTVLFYFHIDGQPVDPSFWFQENPYQATLKVEQKGEGWVDLPWEDLYDKALNPEWRLFARSASDDKAPYIAFLTALKTLQAERRSLPYNLKVILDFEEEIGSPRLAQAVEDNKEALSADMLLIFDGPKHPSNQPTISFGARGITRVSLKVFGPTYPLHSGHYGNYAPNPALRLAKLLASMKDDEGRVTIPGYYDGIELTEEIKSILATVPDDEQALRVKLGIGEIDQVGENYQEALQYPSLNIRGMSSAWVGKEVRTIVPATALAEIDMRLVVESDGYRLQELVRQHVENQGYFVIDRKPNSRERVIHDKICQLTTGGVTKAFRTDFDTPLGEWVVGTVKATFGQEPIRLRTMGGTLPTSPFINTLKVPAVIVPLVNSDNNQHSPNENIRLGNYFDAVKTFYGLLEKGF